MPRRRLIEPALLALAAGNFAHGSANMAVVGLLNEIALDLNVSIGVAGQLASAFQLSAALLAPVIALLAVRVERRALLSAALMVVVIAQGFGALAPSFAVLFAARMLGGAGTATYVPTSIATSALLVPAERTGAAVFAVFLGFNLAAILGVPFGVWLGGLFGWRWTLALYGAVALVALVGVRMTVPAKLPFARLDASALREVLRNRPIRAALGFSLLQASSQGMFYVYIAPQLHDALGAGPGLIGLLLGWAGVTGFIGTLAAMRVIDRIGALGMARVALYAGCAAMLIWPLGRGSLAVAFVVLGLWGVASVVLFTSLQAHLVKLDTRLAPLSVPCNTTMNFAGGTAGAMLGGVIITYVGTWALSWGSLLLLLVALWRSLKLGRREA